MQKKTQNLTISSAAGDVVKSEFLCITGGSANWHHHFEKLFGNYLFIQLYIHLSYDPVVPCPGIHPREMKTCAHTKTCTETFIMVLFVIGRTTQISTNWWVDKQIVVPPHNRIYSAMNRNKLLISKWICLKCLMLSERSQTQKAPCGMKLFIWHSEKSKLQTSGIKNR